MKKLFTLFIVLLVSFSSFSQAPEKISYQAIVRAADGNLVSEKPVGVKISILKSTINGTAVYVETHTPISNVNGLVTLEIGTGGVVTGSFSGIDWGADLYFIKTETDPTGGANYTISSTSQLSSVPYALHAKTASNVFSGDYNDLTNKPKADAVEKYEVGDFAHGGIVFWVDETQQHGLVCAKSNQISAIKWFSGTFGSTQAKGSGVYAGKANNSIIIAAHLFIGDDENINAARLCNELEIIQNSITYGDWYLPSKHELNLMYQNRSTINTTASANGGESFVSDVYWSSTEQSNQNVWVLDFSNGQETTIFKSFQNNVRAIRAF